MAISSFTDFYQNLAELSRHPVYCSISDFSSLKICLPVLRTLRTLAPKDPVRQMEKATEISVQPAKVGNPQTLVSTTNQGDKPPNAPVQQSEKTAAGRK